MKFIVPICIAESSEDDEPNLNREDDGAPVLLRRKRYVRRRDRAVTSLARAMDPDNYTLLPPVTDHVRKVKNFRATLVLSK